MFRSARWKSEKNNKINTVFKLQFHATQVTQLNVETLVISVVPGDIGKPTARLEKGIIREGSCRWGYPIYETVKFTHNTKTGKINERTYHFIVSTGSSKDILVGEVSVDLAGYAEASEVSNVSLPLKNSKCNGVLHVMIERLQRNIHRDLEGNKVTNIVIQDRSLNILLSNSDAEEDIESNYSEERLPNVSHHSGLNIDSRTTSGSDITMSSSESSSGLNIPCEPGLINNLLQDPTTFRSSQNHTSASHKPNSNASVTVYGDQQWEWAADSDHGIGSDDNINSCQVNLTGEKSKGTSDIGIEKLKAQIVALGRQLDLSELELLTLRKQIVKESKRGQYLTREVAGLKEERDARKAENEELKDFQKRAEHAKSKNKSQFEGGDTLVVLDEVRQELNYEKDLNANLQLQLQKTQESNAELILAVKDLKEMLEQKNKQISNLSDKSKSSENARLRGESDDDEEQKALEELIKEHRDAKEAYVLEQKIMDLNTEIEIYKRDTDELQMQLEQLALDYEILKQENHDMSYKLERSELQLKMQYECSSSSATIDELEAKIESLQHELKKQLKEHSDSFLTMSKLEARIMSLEDELDKQSQGFEADLEVVIQARVELEQRAIKAEEALWKTRRKNANTAENMQEEFRRLSMQMASTFDANEKVAMKAWAEANVLRFQKSQFEEMVQKANKELQSVRDDYEAKMQDFSYQLSLKMDQIEQMLVEIDDKSRQLEHQKKIEEELIGSFSQEILMLKGDLENLRIENNILSQQAKQRQNLKVESEQLKSSIKPTEDLVQKGYTERNELASALALAKKEAEKLAGELNIMESLKLEEKKATSLLQTEMETLKARYDDLKHSLLEDEVEKEKLRKQVIQLKGELKEKEDTITSVEKKLGECTKPAVVSDGTETNHWNKSAPIPHGSKEATNLMERITFFEDQIKLKETAVEALASTFLEKERDLLNNIEELEDRLEELNKKNAIFLDKPFQKLPGDIICITSNGSCAIMPEKEMKSCITSNGACNKLMSQLKSLKERNKEMEDELKEMQARYSEISLKFAEVEGERQQLMITVRNLKNANKG